jgi:hypothetical protein
MANHLAAFGKRDYFHKKRHAYNECGQQAFVAVISIGVCEIRKESRELCCCSCDPITAAIIIRIIILVAHQ